MKLHEYQVKKILAEYEIKVVSGSVAYTADEAYNIASELSGPDFFVKAQSNKINNNGYFLPINDSEKIPQIISASSEMDVVTWSSFMLGNMLYNDEGKEQEIHKVYIEKSYEIKKKMYLSLMLDSKRQSLVLISSSGDKTDNIVYEKITTATRPKMESFRRVFDGLGLEDEYLEEAKHLFKSMYKALTSLDALKIEITELILTSDNELLVKEVDAFFDNFSLSRQKEIKRRIDLSDMSKQQELAYKWQVKYTPLVGNISIMTNGIGLGLAMADMIKLRGGEVAQLIDIGWNATKTRIIKAFSLVLASINVDGLLIYVYGGSLHCDEVARGIVAAVKEMSLEIPLVVRLGGTNEDIAKKILANSGLPITIAEDMADSSDLIINRVERKK